MACNCVASSAMARAYGALLLLKLQELIGCKDLHTEDLGRLSLPNAMAGLRKLEPHIITWTDLPEALPEALTDGQRRVGMVFGSNLWEPVAERAFELFQQGLISHFIVSGHQSKRFTQPEGIVVRDYLISKGVEPELIFVDTLASNTGENAQNCTRILLQEFWRGGLPEVMLIAKCYHAHRAMTALEEQLLVHIWGEDLPALWLGVAQIPEYQPDVWLESPKVVQDRIGEVFRCWRYHKYQVRRTCGPIKDQFTRLRELTL